MVAAARTFETARSRAALVTLEGLVETKSLAGFVVQLTADVAGVVDVVNKLR